MPIQEVTLTWANLSNPSLSFTVRASVDDTIQAVQKRIFQTHDFAHWKDNHWPDGTDNELALFRPTVAISTGDPALLPRALIEHYKQAVSLRPFSTVRDALGSEEPVTGVVNILVKVPRACLIHH
jgi:hypothetical protein